MSSDQLESPKFDSGAQRFFCQGKRIPKDVKRHCGMCKQHGVLVETRGHTCEFKNCTCEQCELVRRRREIMSTQIRLRREQDKKFQRTSDVSEADVVPWVGETADPVNMCYFCQKCKNHGILKWKKDHKKKCEFSDCRCEQCDLIDSRRALDRHIKKRRMRASDEVVEEVEKPKKSPRKDHLGSACQSEESSSSSDCSLSSSSTNLLIPPPNYRVNRSPTASNTTASPASSPLENVSPFIATPTFPFLNGVMPPLVAGLTTPMVNSFYNPFFISPLNMQLLLNNIQALSEMTAAVTLANTD